ncbi:hypothetical protein G6F31_018169 [Rhizopus arrhizus]|nr:hypothetical protein G6F31_018169 [Rhizopus arrhizus]
MHDRDQRRGGQVPAGAPRAGPVPHPREATGNQLRRPAGIPQGVQAEPAAVVEGAPRRLHQAAEADPRPPRCHAAGIGAAAQPEPGDLQPGQPRPLRPGAGGVRALHFADPPLPRSAGASRDQARAVRQAAGQVHLQRARNGRVGAAVFRA